MDDKKKNTVKSVIDCADKNVGKYVFREFKDFIIFGEKDVKK